MTALPYRYKLHAPVGYMFPTDVDLPLMYPKKPYRKGGVKREQNTGSNKRTGKDNDGDDEDEGRIPEP